MIAAISHHFHIAHSIGGRITMSSIYETESYRSSLTAYLKTDANNSQRLRWLYPEFYEWLIVSYPGNSKKEKLYCYLNQVSSAPVCLHCGCLVKIKNIWKGYAKFCSTFESSPLRPDFIGNFHKSLASRRRSAAAPRSSGWWSARCGSRRGCGSNRWSSGRSPTHAYTTTTARRCACPQDSD